MENNSQPINQPTTPVQSPLNSIPTTSSFVPRPVQTPPVTSPPPSSSMPHKSSKATVVLFIILLIVIITGGVVYYLTNQIPNTSTIPPVTNQVEKTPQQIPTITPAVTPTVDDDLESFNTPIDDITSDLEDINNDLKGL